MIEDPELLRRYAETRAEDAFAELVRRHLDFVYGVALRRVGDDAHLARDVTQDVFLAVAKQAAALSRRPVLKGWLHTAARFSAAQVVRRESRRRRHEEEAHTMHTLHDDSSSGRAWRELRPVVDDAIGELGDRDRAIVLLRFFEERSYPEIAARLGMSADAARIRGDRALDKLSGLLARRGITSTSAALALSLGHQLGAAAPAGLAPAIVKLAAGGVAAGSIGAGAGFLADALAFLTMTQIKTALLTVAVVGVIATLGIQWRANASLRAEHAALQETATRRLDVLRTENARLARVAADTARWRSEQQEREQLRATAGASKSTPMPIDRVAATGNIFAALVPIEVLQNRGNATPAAAFETLYWAKEHQRLDVLQQLVELSPDAQQSAVTRYSSVPPELRANFQGVVTPEQMAVVPWVAHQRDVAVQVNTETAIGDDRMYLSGHRKDERGISNYDLMLQRTPTGWKWVIDARTFEAALKIESRRTMEERTAPDASGALNVNAATAGSTKP